MRSKGLYPLGLIYPLGPPEGLRFSACLKIRCSLFKWNLCKKAKTLGRRFSQVNADKNKNQR
jgi:hypothetical protein